MAPTAICEVLESAGKLLFGLGFALLAKRRGLDTPHVAAYAVCGITVGMASSAISLLPPLFLSLRRERGGCEQAMPSRREVLFELCRTGLPITLGAAVMSAVSLLDTVLISSRLQRAGFPASVANAMYSSYGNLAIPLYNLVPALLAPVTLALMPLLGGALAQRDEESARAALGSAVRFSTLVGIPASLGLCVFARPLLGLVFAGQDQAIAVAAPLLSTLALSVLPTVMIAVFGAALQATGHTMLPVLATGVGALVKLLCEGVLLTVPQIWLRGAPISTLCCTLTVLLIEWIALSRVLHFPVVTARDLFRPLFATLPAMLLGVGLYHTLLVRLSGGAWIMLPVLGAVATTLLFFALLFGAVEKSDLLTLPAGERICGLLEKCKLLK